MFGFLHERGGDIPPETGLLLDARRTLVTVVRGNAVREGRIHTGKMLAMCRTQVRRNHGCQTWTTIHLLTMGPHTLIPESPVSAHMPRAPESGHHRIYTRVSHSHTRESAERPHALEPSAPELDHYDSDARTSRAREDEEHPRALEPPAPEPPAHEEQKHRTS